MNNLIKVLACSLLFVNYNRGFKIHNNIQNIINLNARFTALTNSLNSEFINENLIINEISRLEYHHQINIVYLLLVIAGFYTKYNYNQKIENKWENLEMFSNTQKDTRKFLLIFMIVFTKNIDNAI